MKFQGGVKEAAKMLAGLSKSAREKVLDLISKKDPKMAETLHKSMYTFDDLQYLTPMMLIELLRSVKMSDMGLALRISSNELKDHIMKNTPRGMRQEIEELLLGPPQLASKVEEAQERIMVIVREKIDKGQLIINKDSSETYV
ncbi:FliG C-terminal domain-containing protein [Bacteriovorax sp. PP10]|jgi:flagellar motor switch protein FliG|uniref:FliG C-terminal domain-containing protein n=1 Tax=Bacteriovorax antarcticus TaxID=3088717 RepID=A0ABU5VXF9_9BACT|nr:FliG C-terminal domain-containing protein [Bacteriovorax sp. PP10]MEA9356310.1 FliG C-terminal domain-containing protein [Bacteriovorax sp. PP10]